MPSNPKNKPYRRLPGRGASGLSVSSLWMGDDHLLMVEASSVGERYKRFFFREIQAFVLRRTGGFVVRTITWLVIVAGALLIGLSVEPPARWFFLGTGGLFACFLVAHVAQGPTCQCKVRTAVQYESLPSLGRLRRARRVIAEVKPFIDEAQAAPMDAASEHL